MTIFGGLGRILHCRVSRPLPIHFFLGPFSLSTHKCETRGSTCVIVYTRLNLSSSIKKAMEATLASPASRGIDVRLNTWVSEGLKVRFASPTIAASPLVGDKIVEASPEAEGSPRVIEDI